MEKTNQAKPKQDTAGKTAPQGQTAAAVVREALAEQEKAARREAEELSCPLPRQSGAVRDMTDTSGCGAGTASNVGGKTGGKTDTKADSKADAKADGCAAGSGMLPGRCAPMVFPYVPVQERNPARFSRMEALETGTLFPGLNLPFKEAIQSHRKMSNTALAELMALDFALQELGLYLTTHADDAEVLRLYWSFVQLAKEGRQRYQERYGPLCQTDLTPEDGFAWLNDPWPWDVGGND